MDLQVGVKILLKNKDGKFLLARRSEQKYKDVKGMWDIIGGRIDPGSPLIDNLKREIKEEINLDFTGTARLVAAQDILRVPGKHVVRLTYVGRIEGEPVLSDENTEYKWLSESELRNFDDLDMFVKEILDQVLAAAQQM